MTISRGVVLKLVQGDIVGITQCQTVDVVIMEGSLLAQRTPELSMGTIRKRLLRKGGG